MMSKLESLKKQSIFAGMNVTKVETLDGIKLNFGDDTWILFRASGTEPLLRIYAEAPAFDKVELLLQEGQKVSQS
jgi:phosphomannomutase